MKLPTIGRLVLCHNANKTGTEWMLCRIRDNKRFYDLNGQLQIVTHWQYLPKLKQMNQL